MSTGVFTETAKAEQHNNCAAKTVTISEPAQDIGPTSVAGITHTAGDGAAELSVVDLAYRLEEPVQCEEIVATPQEHAAGSTKGELDWTDRLPSIFYAEAGIALCGAPVKTSTGVAKAVGKVLSAVKLVAWHEHGVIESLMANAHATAAAQLCEEITAAIKGHAAEGRQGVLGKLTGLTFGVPTSDVSVVALTCRLEKPAPCVRGARTPRPTSRPSTLRASSSRVRLTWLTKSRQQPGQAGHPGACLGRPR